MLDVVMHAMYGVKYCVVRDVDWEKALGIFQYVINTNKKEYFANLSTTDVAIVGNRGEVLMKELV